MKKISITLLLLFTSVNIYCQSDIDKVIKGGEILVNGLSFFKNGKSENKSANSKTIESLRTKKSKDLKPHERFVINVTGEYGCKDFYILKDLKEYNAEDNLVASDKTISEDGSDY